MCACPQLFSSPNETLSLLFLYFFNNILIHGSFLFFISPPLVLSLFFFSFNLSMFIFATWNFGAVVGG